MNMNSFRNLNAYIKAKELVSMVYTLIKKFPKEEQYALCDQLRRAVISIPSNIAEGSGRLTTKDQSHFYSIAYGSLMEVLAQLDVACDLGYLTKEDFQHLETLIDVEAKILTGLVNKRNSSVASTKQ
ncbi:MAG: four helix bundle protein [Paludibacteraceae bacterium]|nr:four helix bundle protein [Paludibacteraceae bacterium]